MSENHALKNAGTGALSRRQFVTAGAAAMSFAVVQPNLVFGAEANTKIDIGLIGCGGRGTWIADLFKKNGNYNVVACADYFPDKVNACGDAFKIETNMRFSGLNGYKKLLEQKLDAVVIETPPYFHPVHAEAAVAAGKHVYLAKPIAVDVPGCQTVETSGKKATEKKQVFLVDFQTRANAAYQETVKRVHNGEIGKIILTEACYRCDSTWGGMDPILRKDPKNPEVRLRAWGVDKFLSGDIITEQNIHALDVACWFMNAAPISAYGMGGKIREFVGDCWDHFGVLFKFPGDQIVDFNSKQVGMHFDDILCRVFGTLGYAETNYFGNVFIRSDDPYNGGAMKNLYTEGVITNIATFHDNITRGNFENATVAPSVRSNLTTILGRTAAYERREVTWDEMMKAATKYEFDTTGMKA
jgi:predicted dehydrogenase